MKAAVIDHAGGLRIEDRDVPRAGADDVVVRVNACGICGTDVHIAHGGFRAEYPVVPGHEFSGEVAEAGSRVTHVQPGDRVCIDPNIHCGVCAYCRRGLIHLCENLTAIGVNRPGGFAEYCLVPARQVYQLPGNVSFEEAAFVEPLACCVHGIDRAQIQASDAVVILGAGSIGLLMLQLVRLQGARLAIVSEPSAPKSEMARSLGADVVLDPSTTDIREAVFALTGIGADVAIECAGSPRTAAQALELTRRGGRVVLFGVSPKEAELPLRLYQVFLNELTVTGSYINPYMHARAVGLIASGRVRVRELISHRFALEEFPHAMELAERGGAVKIMIAP